MTKDQFTAILDNIEDGLDGDGYFVRLRLIDGSTVIGALKYEIPPVDRLPHDMVVAIVGDPDVYVPVSHIVAVEGPVTTDI